MLKLLEGGWFPLLIGGAIFVLMKTWYDGRRLLNESLEGEALPLDGFLESVFIAPPPRADGSAVFMSARPGIVPHALLHNLKHNKVLHQNNLFVTVRNHEVPWIPPTERLEVEYLGHAAWKVIVHYGFMDDPDLPAALELLKDNGVELDPMATSYFLSRDIVIPTAGAGMSLWREKLFSQMHRNASSAADFLKLPNNAVVELGSKIAI
jgi:KUP system potassium uptake protein